MKRSLRHGLFGVLLIVLLSVSLGVAGAASGTKSLQADEDLVRPSLRDELTGERFYFVMPDRFSNGDASNDTGGIPGGKLDHGYDPTDRGFFHGGDLAGLIDKVEDGYLQELGITAIWMSPVFKNRPVQGQGTPFVSAGYHGYWQTDFTRIDPHFGTNAELGRLIQEAHSRGIKVFFDIITNHTADVIDYRERTYEYISKAEEPYRDARGVPFDDRDYAGTGEFPELDVEQSFPYTPFFNSKADARAKYPNWLRNRTFYHNRGNTSFSGENSVYGDFFGLDDLFTEHPRVVKGMTDIFEFWTSEYDIDGFRIDTVKHVNMEFWEQWSPAILEHTRGNLGNEDFFMFGEIFDPNPDFLSIFSSKAKLPAVLDFGFQARTQAFAANGAPTDDLRDFFAQDDWYIDADSNAYSLPTFLGNHDMGRIGMFVRDANPGATEQEWLARDRLAHALMYFSRGMPVVYYGDEQGFTGTGGDQLARQDMFPSQTADYYDDPAYGDNMIGTDETAADDNFDRDHPIYEGLGDLSAVHNAHAALQRGAQLHRYSAGSAGIYAFSRIDRGERIEYVVAANNSESDQTATFRTDTPNATFNAVWPAAAAPITSDETGEVTVTVPGLDVVVFRADRGVPPSDSAPDISLSEPEPFFLAGDGEKDGHTREGLTVEAAIDRDMYAEVSFAASVGGGEWRHLGTDDNAPYSIFFSTEELAAGTAVDFKAIVNDLNGHYDSATISATVPEPPEDEDPRADEPDSVVVPGSFQSELGCPGDWQPDCTNTALGYDLGGDVWTNTFAIPAGSWEYKVALNGSWDENYGAGGQRDGPNIGLSLAEPTTVTFWYDTDTHYVTDDFNSVIVTAPGSFQDEIGCPGDWDPACMGSWLQDPDGNGIYLFTTDDIPAGSYEAKVTHDRSWDVNYGQGGVPNGPNIPFQVDGTNTTVTFRYDISTHVMTIETGP